MGITEPRNDIEYVQTGQKGIAVAVDTITASSDVPKRMKPYDAARKSVIACVSDFAAKGVRPRFGLVSVTVPSSYDVKSIKETARGIADASKKFKIRMLGGDTSFGELSISICLFGLSKKPVGRIGAKTGDGIFTTGRFGYSAAGLHLMLSGKKPANSFEVKAKKAFCRPDARLDFGAAAARHFSSSIDFTSYEDGTVTETSPKRGLTPFAAKSLTHAMTLFLAASYGFILFGTSEEAVIVSTATAIPFWPVCTYSISFLGSVIPMACLIIPVMRSSLTVSCL